MLFSPWRRRWGSGRIPAHPERVSNPVDVVEPGGDQGDLEDTAIVESDRPQPIVELRRNFGGVAGDLLGELEHHAVLLRDGRGSIVPRQGLDEGLIQRDATQKLCV